MVTPVDGDAAAQTLLGYRTCDPGFCLRYVWDAYEAHGATSNESFPTAYSAWLGSAGQHPGDWNPPSGVPVYLGPKASSQAGDVMISLGGGWCAATDWPYNGVIGTCTIQDRVNQTGRPYLGWTETILDYPIAYGDDDMGTIDNNEENYQTIAGFLWRALKWDVRDGASGVPPAGSDASQYGRTLWDRFGAVDNGIAVIPTEGVDLDYDALAGSLVEQGISVAIVTPPAGGVRLGATSRRWLVALVLGALIAQVGGIVSGLIVLNALTAAAAG